MMSRRYSVAIALVASLMIFATGCSKKNKTEESNVPATETALTNELGSSDEGKAMGLQTVHFAFDSFALDTPSKEVLKNNASIMKNNPGLKIQIEGHTDARGGVQYNIALGEKRANAVRGYLTDMGINGDRVSTVSFGKEHPMDSGSSEAAYAKNRRANFVITSR
ncbi:MAG: OmpA family protein [Bdellovibrionia bacterium]